MRAAHSLGWWPRIRLVVFGRLHFALTRVLGDNGGDDAEEVDDDREEEIRLLRTLVGGAGWAVGGGSRVGREPSGEGQTGAVGVGATTAT